jgi:pantetheine-phosphate adenylyltransferase
VSRIAIYPGSFDPVTLGHLSVAARARALCDELIVLVSHNPNKESRFTLEQRIALWEQSIAELGLSGISVQKLGSGLLADAAKGLGASAIVKGLRTSADLDYELQFVNINRELGGIETVFLATEPKYSATSSSLIREVALLGGDVSSHVTHAVAKALQGVVK